MGKDSGVKFDDTFDEIGLTDEELLELEKQVEKELLEELSGDDLSEGEFNFITGDNDLELDLDLDEELKDGIESTDADNDGTIINGDALLVENNTKHDYGISDGFISDTGEIVVMDPNEKGDNFKLVYVDIENIAIVPRIRKNQNVEDLVRSIKSTGLLKPIIVSPTQTEGIYVLIDGFRRIVACAKSGIRRIPCIVNTRVSTPEIPILEAMYNHSKEYNIQEIIDYIEYLEKQKGIMSATMIEYLIQMNSGDYTKLKDLLNDDDEEILSKLFDGTYTIEQAFKKLEQRRKKESAEERDMKKAEKVYGDAGESGAENIAGSGEEADDDVTLSEEEIQSLAINIGDLDSEIEDESLEDMIKEGKDIEGFAPNKQDYRDRERLDPALRKSVLARDENTCQICKQISGPEYTEVLDVHHIQEVYLGGDDSFENLLTTCVVCHKLIHLYGRGDLHIRPLDELSESEKQRFKRIVKLGNIIRKGMAMKGIKKAELKKLDNAETIGRRLKGSSDQVAG